MAPPRAEWAGWTATALVLLPPPPAGTAARTSDRRYPAAPTLRGPDTRGRRRHRAGRRRVGSHAAGGLAARSPHGGQSATRRANVVRSADRELPGLLDCCCRYARRQEGRQQQATMTTGGGRPVNTVTAPAPLTAADRCDRCGARAYIRVVLRLAASSSSAPTTAARTRRRYAPPRRTSWQDQSDALAVDRRPPPRPTSADAGRRARPRAPGRRRGPAGIDGHRDDGHAAVTALAGLIIVIGLAGRRPVPARPAARLGRPSSCGRSACTTPSAGPSSPSPPFSSWRRMTAKYLRARTSHCASRRSGRIHARWAAPSASSASSSSPSSAPSWSASSLGVYLAERVRLGGGGGGLALHTLDPGRRRGGASSRTGRRVAHRCDLAQPSVDRRLASPPRLR